MKIRFNVTGAARKAFVMAVGDLVGWEPVYTKAPTFAYVVNNLTIDKEGTLLFPGGDGYGRGNTASGGAGRARLSSRGFTADRCFSW